ncbi:MAG: serine dehydratase beta chain, partial [Odoribacter laneus]
MKSIKEIFRMGYGPSSSHTMGPSQAAEFFKNKHPEADKYRITLYGSLALTGKGHGTDTVINKVIGRPEDTEIVWRSDVTLPRHPNGMVFECLVGEEVTDKWEVYSVGGGALWDAEGTFDSEEIYPVTTMGEVLEWCKRE